MGPPPPPPCMHCGEQFRDHRVQGDERWCRDGRDRFNVVFDVNPDVRDFIADNSEASPDDLAKLWVERLRRKVP